MPTRAQLKLEANKSRIITEYLEGEPVQQLAGRLGVCSETLRAFLICNEVAIRNPGQARRLRDKLHPDEGAEYLPTLEEIEEQKKILREKHFASRKDEYVKDAKISGLERIAMNEIPVVEIDHASSGLL